jgi:hypothetical protein
MIKQIKFPTNHWLRLMQVLWLCGLLGFASERPALAQCPPPFQGTTYENDSIASNTCPPYIDAINFINQYDFTLSLSTFTMYETWDTLNYTNNDSMVTDAGFLFDTQSSSNYLHSMAANFFNPGTITCASATGPLLLGVGGQFIVNATNISMPGGTVDVGMGGGTAGGLISFTGQNVDLSTGTLTLEDSGTVGGGLGSVRAFPIYSGGSILYYYSGFGVDTNGEWNPGVYLQPTYAEPSYVKVGPAATAVWTVPPGFPSYPVSTTPYVSVFQSDTNDIIYNYVFVANTVSSVTANAYLFPGSAGSSLAAVEFVGSYTNPATGLTVNNYLDVEDDYALGAAKTALTTATQIPDNFYIAPSSTSLLGGYATATSGFLSLPNGAISNSYSYADVQCNPTTVPTNGVTQNTNDYLAVMPSKIVINASSNLDLSGAAISGQNYLSVTAPGLLNAAGAAISSAYSDINVGVTNVTLMATNLLEPIVPAWSGTLQVWSTRFINLTTNSIVIYSNTIPPTPVSTNSYTVTNDYNVLIVANEAVPTTPSEVWNMALHNTNSIVISDSYNILNSLYLDCVSLTLTTNGPGAPSPYGELNLQDGSFGNPIVYNVWSNSAPYLLYLTNDGDILLPNVGDFGGPPPANYVALVSQGLISDEGSQVWANDFEGSGAFLNGAGPFTLHSLNTMLTNETITAGADVSITATNLSMSSLSLEADRSLTLTATNLLTDTGVTNGSVWTVGLSSIGNGISVPILPAGGGGYGSSLLGTTINLFAPTNHTVVNVWPGTNCGLSTIGYSNNLAVGQLILDSLATSSKFRFNGVGTSNAIYVDRLELLGNSDYNSRNGTTNIPSLLFNNLVIYYADAVSDGQDVSVKLNGFNTNHLVWMPAYVGYFSSTNLVFGGTTNTVNAGLAQNGQIDSNGDGIQNASDPFPFYLASQMNLTVTATNHPPKGVISWNTCAFATNDVFYSTNLLTWQLLTNIAGYPSNLLARQGLTNFISIFPPPSPGVPGWVTNVTVFDANTNTTRFYRVSVQPWLTYPY